MANPCGVAHFKNAPCRECERIRKRDVVDVEGSTAAVSRVRPPVDKLPERPSVAVGGSGDVAPEVVVSEGSVGSRRVSDEVARKALSDAERAKRYREKKKSEDPDYLSREAQRQRNRRKG